MNHEVSSRVLLKIPRDQAWALLQDLTLSHHYVPGVLRCEIRTEQRQGLGASRRIYQKMGRWMDETVTEWNEGGGFVIRLHRGQKGPSAPFKNAQFRYRIEDAGNNQTALTTSLMFDMRWGRFGKLLYRRVLASAFRGVVRTITNNMKAFYEEQGRAVKAPANADDALASEGH